jgi:hypothetical protein
VSPHPSWFAASDTRNDDLAVTNPGTLRAHGRASLLAPLGLLVLSTSLQFARLESVPPCGPELEISAEVHAFVRSGYVDRAGRRFPLFAEGLDKNFYAPVPVYAAALSDAVTGSPPSFRLAAAAAAVASVLLTYAVATLAFGSVPLATMTAAFVLATPAHVALGRTFTHEGVWHVPFVCGWLLSLAIVLERRNQLRWPLALCTALIVSSVYSQPSAAIAALVLVVLTAMALHQSGPLAWRDLRLSIAAAAAFSAPLLLWFVFHPSTYGDTFGSWLLHAAHIRSPRAWWLAVSHPNLWTRFSETYWNFFSPTHLLVSDTAPAMTGVFLLPIGVLAALGVYAGVRSPAGEGRGRLLTRIAMLGVLCLPLSAASFLDQASIDRAQAIVPLVALLAANGAKWLWTSALKRSVCAMLLVAAIAQFALWYAGTIYPIQKPTGCERSGMSLDLSAARHP